MARPIHYLSRAVTPDINKGAILLRSFRVPGPEFLVVRHFFRIDLRIDWHVNDADFAAGIGAGNGRPDVLLTIDIFTVATEALGDFVEPHFLAPVHSGFQRSLAKGALVDTYLEAPLKVGADDADERKLQARGGFQLRDMEHERRVAGKQ